MNSFSNPDAIQSYVYALEDPRDNKIFYIGKGVGNRVFEHAKDARKQNDASSEKLKLIKKIIKEGHDVKSYVIKYGLSDEEAISYEAVIIETLKKFGHDLTNIVAGHHTENLFLSTNEVERKFGFQKIRSLPKNSVILNINKSYKKGSSNAEIYTAAKQSWSIDAKKRNILRYVFVEYQSVIIAMFKDIDWYEVLEDEEWIKKANQSKWGFKGKSFIDHQFINKLLPERTNFGLQRRYCLDGETINDIVLLDW